MLYLSCKRIIFEQLPDTTNMAENSFYQKRSYLAIYLAMTGNQKAC